MSDFAGSTTPTGGSFGRIFGFFCAKGGSGVSTVVALSALALISATKKRSGSNTPKNVLIVDLCGDISAVLGCDDPGSIGLAQWSRSEPRDITTLSHISKAVNSSISILPRGLGPIEISGADLVDELRGLGVDVLIDIGAVDKTEAGETPPIIADDIAISEQQWRRDLLDCVDVDIVVTRNCFLGLRRLKDLGHIARALVVLVERGRSISTADVELVAQSEAVAEIDIDQRVFRCVDAGLLVARVPRKLLSALANSLADTVNVELQVAS